MAKTKGKPRHYEEWEPEYTPKTHNLTSKSKRELNEIRAQSIAEGAVDHFDMDDVWTGGSFVGLTFCFKYGVNPSIMKLFQLGGEAIDFIKDNWVSFIIPYNVFEGGIEKLWQFEVKTPIPIDEHESIIKKSLEELITGQENLLRHHEGILAEYDRKIAEGEAAIKRFRDTIDRLVIARDKAIAEGTMTGGDWVEPAADLHQRSIDRMELQILNINTLRYGGDIVNVNINPATGIRGDFERIVKYGYEELKRMHKEEYVDPVLIELDGLRAARVTKVLTKKSAKKIFDKVETLNWIFSMGEAGSLIYLLKSYETSEIISNIKPGG